MTTADFRSRLTHIDFMPIAFLSYLAGVADALKPESRASIIRKLENGQADLIAAATKATRAMSEIQSTGSLS